MRPRMFTFARSDARITVPENLQLYCHFEILIDSAVQPDVLLLLEELIHEVTQSTNWKVKIFFFRQQSVTTRSYKIAVFGEQAPITREKADIVRLRIINELVRRCDTSNFPFLSGSRSRTISNPCPTSILSGYMNNPGGESSAATKGLDQDDDGHNLWTSAFYINARPFAHLWCLTANIRPFTRIPTNLFLDHQRRDIYVELSVKEEWMTLYLLSGRSPRLFTKDKDFFTSCFLHDMD